MEAKKNLLTLQKGMDPESVPDKISLDFKF